MDQHRVLLGTYFIGFTYGGFLYFLNDFAISLTIGPTQYFLERWISYMLASILSSLWFSICIPCFQWSFAQDQYRQSPWKLHSVWTFYFSCILPFATFSGTEWILQILRFDVDPNQHAKSLTLMPMAFLLTTLLELGKGFDKLRLIYLDHLLVD